MLLMTNNSEELRGWCEEILECEIALEALAGDAGARRYHRLRKMPWLAVQAPPARSRNEEWLAVGRLLAAGGVRVPKVRACDLERGFLLIEDFGDRLLLSALEEPDADVEALYQRALETLVEIQRCPVRDERFALPPAAPALAVEERGLFEEWFVEKLLEMKLRPAEREMLQAVWLELLESLDGQPRTLVHRDYHSRNLALLDDGSLGVLDFQDALCGPPAYDLASLLKDCYVSWPRQRTLDRLRRWRALAAARGLECGDEESLVRDFDAIGLQRHLRVLGTFARLWLREGKPRYLHDVPRIIDYVVEASRAHPNLARFADWVDERLIPRLGARLPEILNALPE